MKLIDVNILLYAVNADSPFQSAIRPWLESALEDDERIGLAWVTLVGFLRVSTHPRAFSRPLTVEVAMANVDKWLTHPNVRVVKESDEHWRILQALLKQTGTAGNLTSDAHLAALAISHSAELVSCDADFARFPRLRWRNPLQ
jgi:toxin-antitoxin system PIN domain toxin